MTGIYQFLQAGRSAIGILNGERENTVVSPIARAGKLCDRHDLDDIAIEGAYDSRLREALLRVGTRALLAIPLLREERILGGLIVSRRAAGRFAPEVVSVLKTSAQGTS